MYLIGTDEAGYGPNLGPLVVSTTLWRVPDHVAEDLYPALADAVTPGPVAKHNRLCAPIADSKRLYSSGGSWEQLELGLLAALGACGQTFRTWREVWAALSPTQLALLEQEHWSAAFDMPTPHAADAAHIEQLVARLLAAGQQSGVQLQAVASRPVFAAEFNALIDRFDNKSSVLAHVTLEQIQKLVEATGLQEPVLVHCDKLGGRNSYAALLQHFFPDHFIEIHHESREKSIYRFGPPPQRVEIRFVAKGDNFLPAALASMACKYLRELAMHAFNGFWRQHVPNLKPTAGYPEDAKRFKRDIAAAQAKLGIADEVLWRKR